jgi:NAD(P)-dependent dehydrogenase (short-subunit alcohol dehydrogenase family)
MASFSSIQAFVQKASAELDRIDGFIANAGIMVDKWQLAEGMEITMFVNVVGTIFLGVLIMPQLIATGRKFGTHPTLSFVGSTLGYSAKSEIDKSRKGGLLFDGFNDEKRAMMAQRYSLSKLVEECAIRQLAALCPVAQTGVVINIVAPGLCSTGLGRDTGSATKAVIGAFRAMGARTPEVGSRVILSGLALGDDSHGKLISGCKIKEYWMPSWLNNVEGQKLQEEIWKELAEWLEKVRPGCISQHV